MALLLFDGDDGVMTMMMMMMMMMLTRIMNSDIDDDIMMTLSVSLSLSSAVFSRRVLVGRRRQWQTRPRRQKGPTAPEKGRSFSV